MSYLRKKRGMKTDVQKIKKQSNKSITFVITSSYPTNPKKQEVAPLRIPFTPMGAQPPSRFLGSKSNKPPIIINNTNIIFITVNVFTAYFPISIPPNNTNTTAICNNPAKIFIQYPGSNGFQTLGA